MGRHPLFMSLSEILPILIGTALGFLSGLGVGGGNLLILWLTLIQGVDDSTARSINLLFFLPSAVIACLFNWKRGTVHPKTILPALLSGGLSALLGNYLSRRMDTQLLRRLYGFLLIFTGIRELLYRPKNRR